ncbi:hypothetical protein BWI97_27200, partial [Siphonobacter sp. BAB-5405]
SKSLGVTRQAVYHVFASRLTMEEDELVRWSEILDTPVAEILDRANGNSDTSKVKSNESLNFGNEVVERFEEHFRKMEEFYHEQLRAKDQQIEKLLGLLGKSEGCPVANLNSAESIQNEVGVAA